LKTQDEVIDNLVEFGNKNENIRAMLLTSSRANPKALIDFLSDYDIELYVKNIEQILLNDNWVEPLGNILIRWPRHPKSTFNQNWITRLILFQHGTRIDFQITDNPNERLQNIDHGFKIILDKDHILTGLPLPTHTRFNVKKPTKEEYEMLVNEFWWDATYIPKYLWRDELPYAKSMMAESVQNAFLKKVIEWHIGIRNNWSVNTGANGRFFKRLLEPKIWEQYAATYSGPNLNENWEAFFMAIDLFSTLAKSIGDQLGYEYPMETELQMRAFYDEIRGKERKAEERGV
jgi:aminoglycoside 6-adenylyltransferase